MELRDYLRILRNHWIGVLAITVVVVAGALAFSLQQTKVYAANATGFVSTGQSKDAALSSVSDTLAKSRATSYVDIAQGRATAQDVIDELGLTTTPQALIGQVSVVQPPDTVLLKFTATANTPKGAQDLADAWVRAVAKEVASIEDPSGREAPGTLRVVPIESAALPSSPVTPNIPRNLGLGLVLGLLLGFGYAVLRSLLDRRLRRVADIEERFPVHVVGSVPMVADLRWSQGQSMPLVVDDRRPGDHASHLAASEAFRKLRTNLRFMDVDAPPRIIVITSPKPGDGKSTVAANLAGAIALSGQPTVLIDADLRRPCVADALGLVGAAGLTDVLTRAATVDEVLQDVAGHPDLKVLASGAEPPNPSELLGSQSMRNLLDALAVTHTLIVDAPPLLPVTDAAELTATADGCFVVVSAGSTLDSDLAAALGHIDDVNGRTLGVIFNKVRRNAPETGYYRSDYYNAAPVGGSQAPAGDEVPAGALRTRA